MTHLVGFEEFSSKESGLRTQLTRAIAARDGIDIATIKNRLRAEDMAFDAIDEWKRKRREPQDRIEQLCEDIFLNELALQEERQRRQASRAALKNPHRGPEPDPNFVTLIMTDEGKGRRIKVTLPASAVEYL